MTNNGIFYALLGEAGPAAWVPEPAPSSPPAPASSQRLPAPYDPVIAQLRPTVDVARTFRVGPEREYKTITSAVLAASSYQAGSSAPLWCDIIIDPGVYTKDESPKVTARNMGFYSASGEKNSVTWLSGIDYALMPFYCEGIVLDARTIKGPKYSIHGHDQLGGTAVMAGCTLTYSLGGGYPVGADGKSGGYFAFYDCDLVGANASAFTNQHHEGSPTGPYRQVFVKTSFPDGAFVFNGMGGGQADELWVVDSVGRAAALVASGPGAVFAVSGSSFTGDQPVGAVDRRDWPRPAWRMQ